MKERPVPNRAKPQSQAELIEHAMTKKKTYAVIDPENLQLERGYNTELTTKLLELYRLPRVRNEDELEERLDYYFQWCSANDMKPSVATMALACGVDRRTMWKWETGQEGSTPRKRDLVKKAKALLNGILEDYMLNGKVNPVTGIFLSKNHFGYRDQQEVVLTPTNPLGEDTDVKTLEEKYSNIPD